MRNRRKRPTKKGLPGPRRGVRAARGHLSQPSIETASGVCVRSKPEQVCADLLFEEGISFQYEPLILLGGRQFRPDFYLPGANLFVEICGYGHMPHYRSRVSLKKGLYRQYSLPAIFVDARSMTGFRERLREELVAAGVDVAPAEPR